VRQAAWALYAFCRRADDAVDEDVTGAAAERRVEALRRRHAQVYAGGADDDPIDRAFAAVVARYALPRALPEALLSGMEMDARGAPYDGDDDLYRYCFRVAATWRSCARRISASPCSSPTSPATSARTRAAGASTCRARCATRSGSTRARSPAPRR
jgi:phytoene/squalene synthetase